MDYAQILTIILGLAAIITYIVNIVKGIINPNKAQDKDIALIKKDVEYIKMNHLDHMEKDLSYIKGEIIKINTILEERFDK